MGLPLPFGSRLVALTVDRLSAGTISLAAYGRRRGGESWVLSRSWSPEGAYGSVVTSLRLPEGILDGAVVSLSGAAADLGDAWCALKLRMDAPGEDVDAAVLAAGWLTALNSIGYPAGGRPNAGLDTQLGHVEVVSSPAAGAEWSYTVPVGTRALLLCASAVLTTSAVAASRRASLIIDDGTTVLSRSLMTGAMAASSAANHTWAPGLVSAGVVSTAATLATPRLQMLAGWRARSLTDGIDGGDQWSAIRLVVGYAPSFAP